MSFLTYQLITSYKSLYIFLSHHVLITHQLACTVSPFSLDQTIEHDSFNNSHSCTLPLTFIYILTIFLRPNKQNKNARKRPPGPLTLPVIGNIHLFGTIPHRNLQSLANKYGPIMSVWLGKVPVIVVSSPEAAELFLKTHDPVFADRPQTQATDYIFYGSKGIVFSQHGSYWRNMKKLCIQDLFSASNKELFSCLRREEIKMVVKSLENAAKMGEVVNISEKVHGCYARKRLEANTCGSTKVTK